MMQLASPKFLDRVDRPREKLRAKGVSSLTDLELLQVMLGSGVKGVHVGQLAIEVLKLLNKRGQVEINLANLSQIRGMNVAKASLVLAGLEFARRYHTLDHWVLDDPENIIPLVNEYAFERQEHLLCISVDGAQRMIAKRVVTVGTLTNTLVHPREVFADAIVDRAAGIILVHNHPSNVASPSEEDAKVTEAMASAGRVLGISLYDHLIITRTNGWYSFRRSGKL